MLGHMQFSKTETGVSLVWTVLCIFMSKPKPVFGKKSKPYMGFAAELLPRPLVYCFVQAEKH